MVGFKIFFESQNLLREDIFYGWIQNEVIFIIIMRGERERVKAIPML